MTRFNLRAFMMSAAMFALADSSHAQWTSGSVLTDSFDNTAVGLFVLPSNSPNTSAGPIGTVGDLGVASTGVGYAALAANTTGAYNAAVGAFALYSNTTGTFNNAFGYASLGYNQTGNANTAYGHNTMEYSTTGGEDTAVGTWALQRNSTGSYNTAVGYVALTANNVGINNAGLGAYALASNTTGSGNNAQGYQAMYHNTTGSNNSAIGSSALFSSTTGIGNNAVGLTALVGLTTGNRNTAVGNNAGLNLGSGSYNTYIGWGVNGSTGVSVPSENYVTRIGVTYADPDVAGSPKAYISGIFNSATSGGLPVYVTSTGQLGFNSSSERYKTDITSLGSNTERLAQLRPVSFHVKTDPNGKVQYGLIAEEVDKVYPELVIRDAEGSIQGVRYDELAPMLLNEAQKQQARIAAQAAQIRDLNEQVAKLDRLGQELGAALRQLQAKGEIVAQR
jgi:hypothetical protein